MNFDLLEKPTFCMLLLFFLPRVNKNCLTGTPLAELTDYSVDRLFMDQQDLNEVLRTDG